MSIPAVQVGETHVLNITLDKGNDITVEIDWGDDTLQSLWFADPTDIVLINHTFSSSEPGQFDVNVTLSNNISNVVTKVVAHLDNVITGPSCRFQNMFNASEEGSASKFVVSADGGSRINTFFRYDDTYLEYQYYEDFSTLPDGDPDYHEYTYALFGNYSVVCYIGNSLDVFEFPILVSVVTPLLGWDLDLSSLILPTGHEVTFSQTLVNGSHLYCDRDFGDGTVQTVYDYLPEKTVEVIHTYSSAGVCHVNWTCYNNLGEVNSLFVDVYIEDPLSGLVTSVSELDVVFGTNAQVTWSASAGTSVEFYVSFSPSIAAFSTILYTEGNLSGLVEFDLPPVGYHEVLINGSNQVSNSQVMVQLIVDKSLVNLQVVPDMIFVEPNGTITFDVSIVEGSFALFFTDFDDGYSHIHLSASESGFYSFQVTHSWFNIGDYIVRHNASNNVSELYQELQISVENALGPLTGETNGQIQQMEIYDVVVPVTFEFVQLSGLVPTNVQVVFDYYGDGATIVEDITIDTGTPYSTYHNYEKFGVFETTVLIHNGVSNASFVWLIQVGVNISDTRLSLNTVPISIGQTVQFTAHVQKGSAVNYTLEYGDGTDETLTRHFNIPTDWLQPDDTTFNHIYSSAGFYTATLTATNEQGSFTTSISNISVYSNVSGVVAVPSSSVAAVNEELTFEVISEGSLTTFHVDYGDGIDADLQFHPEFDAPVQPLTFTHSYDLAGNYTPIFTVNNSINVERVTLPAIIIQEPLTSLSLSDNSVVSFADGAVTYTVNTLGHPTDVFCKWTFGDGIEKWTYATGLTTVQRLVESHSITDSSVGTHITHLNCSNLVSYKTAQVETTVQREITNPRIIILYTAIPVGGQAAYRLLVHQGTHLRYQCNYGPESQSFVNENETSTKFDGSYNYLETGNYTIDCKIYNNISEYQVSGEVIVQTPVPQDIQIVSNSPVAYGEESLVFTITTSTRPDSVFIDWDIFGDGSTRQVVFTPGLTLTGSANFIHTLTDGFFGMLVTKANCSNLINYVMKNIQVLVQKRVVGLVVTPSLSHVSTQGEVEFTIKVSQGTNITYTVSFGDESENEQTTVEGDSSSTDVSFSHVYGQAANYSVAVVAENDINILTNEVDNPLEVIVQAPIISEELHLDYEKYVDYSSENVVFTLGKAAGAEIAPTDVHVSVNFGDGSENSLAFVDKWPFSMHYTYSEANLGNITTVFGLANLVSTGSIEASFEIQERPATMTIDVPKEMEVPGSTFKFSISLVKGSHLSLSVDFGDSNTVRYDANDIRQRTFQFSHIYTNPGIYVISATATNMVDEVTSFSEDIRIEAAVTQMTLYAPSVVPLPNGVMEYTVVSDPNEPAPKEVEISVRPGDGSLAVVEQGIDLSQDYIGHYTYTTAGKHTLEVNVSNSGGSQSLFKDISIMEVITELDFTFSAKEKFALNEEIQFVATQITGSDIVYTWEFLTGAQVISHSPNTIYSFSVPGYKDIVLTATNNVSTATTNKGITIAAPIAIHSFDLNRTVIIGEPVTFSVELTAQLEICYSYSLTFNEVITRFWRGTSASMCDKDTLGFDPISFDLIPISLSDKFTRVLSNIGVYEIELVAIAQGGSVTMTDEITVNDIPCDPPSLTFKSGSRSQTPNDALEFTRSEPVIVDTKNIQINILCEVTTAVNAGWSLFSYNDVLNVRGVKIDLAALEYQRTLDGIEIPKRKLIKGTYEAVFSLEMDGVDNKGNNISMFVKVIASPLEVGIVPGEYRLVGYQKKLEINAIDITFDPDSDEDDKSAMKFAWYCSRNTEDERSALLTDIIAGNAKLITVPRSVPPSSERKIVSGCFGTGPGVLDIDEGSFELDTGHMVPDTVYVLKLRASKDVREGWTEQLLDVSAGEPPETQLTCVGQNCKKKINIQRDFVIWAECLTCTSGPLIQFDWILQMDSTVVSLADISQTKALNDGKTGSLTIYANSLEQDKAYTIEVHVVMSGFEPGVAKTTFTTNLVPWGGSCAVSPSIGEALEEFVISCHDWVDEGTGEVGESGLLSYEYAYVLDNVMTTLATDRPRLPQGDPDNNYQLTINIRILDMYGSYAQVNYQVKIRPPEGGQEAMLDKASELTQIDPSQALLSPGSYLATIAAAGSMVDEPPAKGSSGDGGSGAPTVSRTEAARAAAAAEEAARKEQEKKQAALVANMMMGMSQTMAAAKTAGVSLSSEQTMAFLSTFAATSKKISPNAEPSSANTALDFVSGMANSLENLPPEKQEKAATSMMASIGGALQGIDTEPPVEEEVDPEQPISEEEQERLAAIEAENQKQQRLGLKKTAETLLTVAEEMKSSLSENAKLDGDAVTVGTEALSVTLAKVSQSNLAKRSFSASNTSSINVPPFDADSSEGGDNVVFALAYSKENFLAFGEGASDISSGVTSTSLQYDSSQNVIEFEAMDPPLEVTLSNDVPEDVNMTTAEINGNTGMVYMHIEVNAMDGSGALVLDLKPGKKESEAGMEFEVYIRLNASAVVQDQPNITQAGHDLMEAFPDMTRNDPWLLVVKEELIHPPGVYIGILPIEKEDVPHEAGSNGGKRRKKRAATETTANATVPEMSLKTAMTRCRAWDSTKEKWRSDTCSVGNDSDIANTRCKCTRLTHNENTYGGGFKVPTVNPINFSNIFNNFSALLTGNPTVFAVIFVLLGLYIGLAILVRYFDKKDIERWGVTPLVDNRRNQKVYYKVSVYTGMRSGSGTKSRPSFILSGDRGDTGVRVLDDGKRMNFGRGSLRHFVMSTEEDLGTLVLLRVWHDNSGPGENAGWFLDKVVVEDLHSNRRYFFLCGRWLAVDEDDGQVERSFPVAGQEEVTGFQHLFFSKARRKLTEDHIWFSVVSRPTRSNFTRLQRLTCCVTLLFTTMIANCMFYQADENNENDLVLRLGPIVISASTLLVSIFSSLIVIPPNTLIVSLFRKSKPKNWSDSENGEEQAKAIVEKAHKKKEKRERGNVIRKKTTSKEDGDNTVETGKKMKWWKQKHPFPYWGSYIAWGLAICSILTSAFFVIFYSLEWGKARAEEWLSALFLSTIQSIVLIQPASVIFTAVVISLLFRTLDDDDDDEKANKNTNTKPAAGEEMLFDDHLLEKRTDVPELPNSEQLQDARLKREREKALWSMIKEAAFYFLFLFLVSFIAWGSKDDLFFRFNNSILELFESNLPKGSQVKNGHKFWHFMNNTAVPTLFNMKQYNEQPTKIRERGFLNDQCNFRVGSVRLRQVRVIPNSCDMIPQVEHLLIECNEAYSLFTEESRNFTAGWVLDIFQNETELDRYQKAYRFKSAFELRGLPYWGRMATYGGGGYVADLGITAGKATKVLSRLREADWVDYYTRAVFLEFTVYNVNINLFAFVDYLFEFPPIGGIVPFPRIMSFRVYSGLGAFGVMLLIAQLAYCVIIIYFIVHEALKFKKQRSAYFKELWNVYEIVLIAVSIAAIAIFISKEGFGRLVIMSLKKDKEAFTNYMALAKYDELYSYVVGIIIFMANVKFLRLLRFNKHIGNFVTTLKLARKDLVYFFLTFLIVFAAFGSWGYFLFGRTMYTFSSFIFTVETLYSMLIGKFDFKEIAVSAGELGPVFFILYSLVVFFILINMLLGILGTAYSAIRDNPCLMSDEYEVMEFLVEKVKGFFCRKKPRGPLPGIEGNVAIEDVEYLDHVDVLEKRLVSMNRFLTEQYRHMLGMAKPEDKSSLSEDSIEKTKRLAFLAKLSLKTKTGGSRTTYD